MNNEISNFVSNNKSNRYLYLLDFDSEIVKDITIMTFIVFNPHKLSPVQKETEHNLAKYTLDFAVSVCTCEKNELITLFKDCHHLYNILHDIAGVTTQNFHERLNALIKILADTDI